jgi:hypothetical protein
VLAYRLAGGSGSIDHDLANAPKKRVTGREFIAVAGVVGHRGVCAATGDARDWLPAVNDIKRTSLNVR